MSEYVFTDADNGGVHINMGPGNKASYLIGEDLGRDRLGDIYAGVVTTRLGGRPQSYRGLADSTHEVAGRMLGRAAANSVRDAWAAVDLRVR